MNKVSNFDVLIKSVNQKLNNKEALTFAESKAWCIGLLNIEFSSLIQLREYIQKVKIHSLSKEHCNDYIFLELMDAYFTDLSFTSDKYYRQSNKRFTKQENMKIAEKMDIYIEQQFKNDKFDKVLEKNHWQYLIDVGLIIRIDKETIDGERSLLEKYAEEWDTIISKGYHKDRLLQIVTEEAIYTRKLTKKDFKLDENLKKKNKDLKINLLNTKRIFLEAKEIVRLIEKEEPFPIILKLKGKKILYDFESVIHILNRHYARYTSINNFLLKKSYHKMMPEEIHPLLKYCFSEFEKCQFLKSEDIEDRKSMDFEYLRKKYRIYLNGLSDSQFDIRVASFFPLENEKDIQKLENYDLVKLNNELALYVSK